MNAQPKLCLGNVMHRRLRPAVNAFVYPVFYVQLPLRQLAAARCAFFSIDRRNLVSFYSKDHGPRDGSPLLPWLAMAAVSAPSLSPLPRAVAWTGSGGGDMDGGAVALAEAETWLQCSSRASSWSRETGLDR